MNLEIADRLRAKAGRLACRNPVYNWSLGGYIPEKIEIRPVDAWSGDAEKGRFLCSGNFDFAGEQLEMHGNFWEAYGMAASWHEYLHSFEWLRDLRALGGDTGRAQARDMLESWMDKYSCWNEGAWRPDILGRRIAMWIALYDFYGSSADDRLQSRLLDSLVRQSRHLGRVIGSTNSCTGTFYSCKGLLFAGVALSGYDQWIDQALSRLDKEIDRQILSDGGHISRNPSTLLEVLQILLDIRGALNAVSYPMPAKIQHTIDKMCPALRFFRYSDRHLSVFNGSCEGDASLMDSVMVHANARGKALRSLPQSGYERISLGKSVLFADCGKTPSWPFDEKAHASPLAFEFCHGKDRVFVNCGTHETNDEWHELLRGTAAHTDLCINYRNACEIKNDGHFGRRVKNITVERQEGSDACLLDMSHDGYVQMNGIIHRRRLYLSDHGNDLRGEDTLTCSTGLTRPAEIAARFHLHPKARVSLIKDGTAALISFPSGNGWSFSVSAGMLELEDSIYMCSTGPRKTKQIAVYGVMENDLAQIKWRLFRERN